MAGFSFMFCLWRCIILIYRPGFDIGATTVEFPVRRRLRDCKLLYNAVPWLGKIADIKRDAHALSVPRSLSLEISLF